METRARIARKALKTVAASGSPHSSPWQSLFAHHLREALLHGRFHGLTIRVQGQTVNGNATIVQRLPEFRLARSCLTIAHDPTHAPSFQEWRDSSEWTGEPDKGYPILRIRVQL